MDAQQIVSIIQNENIGSVIFRYSQGKDSTVGGSGLSGVCEGMCYNFVRHFLFQPHTGYQTSVSPYQNFKAQRDAGELAGGVFVKDASTPSPVALTTTEKTGERQAASGVRFSQAVRNLDAKFKKPLSDDAREIITHSFDQDIYQRYPLSKYTEQMQNAKYNLEARDAYAELAQTKDVGLSHLAPLLARDAVKEGIIMYGDLPIVDLLTMEADEQTPETIGKLFGEELQSHITLEAPPQRVLAICDVNKDQSGHAIALNVINPNGPINVLDPNFGLIKYNTWDNFRRGLGKMWLLYQASYPHYTLRRYTKV